MIERIFNEHTFNSISSEGGGLLRRSDQREKRRNDILLAALDLFIRKGYAATTVNDIARRVEMSAGLLFHYFPSKEKLYEELIRIGLSGPQSLLAIPADDPLAFFAEAARLILDSVKTQPFTAKMFVLMDRTFFSEGVPESCQKLMEGFDHMKPTVAIVAQGQREGSIRPGDPKALALAFWSAIQGVAAQIALFPDSPCPEPEWIVDILKNPAPNSTQQ